MLELARLGLGLMLSVFGWRLTVPRSRPTRVSAATLLDLAAPIGGFGWLAMVTGRPLLSGLSILAVFGGLAFGDRAKRQILAEPALFSDLSLLILILRHPGLYLAYVGYVRVASGAAALVAAFAAALWLEPSFKGWDVFLGAAWAAAGVGLVWALAGPLLGWAAAGARRLAPTGDPEQDAAKLGLLATLLSHGLIARSERMARQGAVVPPPLQSPPVIRGRLAPVVIVQAESFFDARRLHPRVPGDLLPSFEQHRTSSLQWGRLDVRGRGGNTMRTEFDVLTGLSAETVGLDWRNPYHAFARRPVDSLAWRFRSRGYRTVCVHPFDRTFFGRDQVMPNLGFETFWGEEAFEDAERDGRYIADAEVARMTDRLLQEGDGLFLFAITVANHGPWGPSAAPAWIPADAQARRCPQAAGWIEGLQRSDAMLGDIAAALDRRGDGGLLAFFGDHPPCLPALFDAAGFEERTTDYLLWRSGEGQAPRRDCTAAELSRTILSAAEPA